MLGGTLAKRTGRKRKSGARGSTGRLKQEPHDSPQVIAMKMPHRRSVKPDARHDQKAESPLGRLNLNGFITNEQFRAGEMFASTVARRLSLMGAPNASPPSIAGFMQPGQPGDVSDEPEHVRNARWIKQYDDAYERASQAGHLAMVALRFVAVQGLELPHGSFPHLLRGLRELERFYGLTSWRKSPGMRN